MLQNWNAAIFMIATPIQKDLFSTAFKWKTDYLAIIGQDQTDNFLKEKSDLT